MASWDEVQARFSCSPKRERLYRGLRRGAENLQGAGCNRIWLDGSFVTDKHDPADFDACWATSGVDLSQLDPILLDFDDDRLLQKIKYGGEFLPNVNEGTSGLLFSDFFQIDKDTGAAKGVLLIPLSKAPA